MSGLTDLGHNVQDRCVKLPFLRSFFPLTHSDDPNDPYEHTDDIDVSGQFEPYNGELPKPIHAGIPRSTRGRPFAGDPTDALLIEMEAYFRTIHELDLDKHFISADELCTMPKTPGKACAIPHRMLWSNMAYLLKNVWVELREDLGVPLTVRAYRPPDYNAAVRGEKGSRHQWFQAMDIYVNTPQATLQRRKMLVEAAADIYITRGLQIKMGFGVYGSRSSPSHIHVDAGWQRRTWGEAAYFVSRKKK